MSSQSQEKTYVAVAVVVAIIVVAGLLIVVYTRIPTRGRIKAIGVKVYAGPDLTTEVSAIDWGTLEPGGGVEAYVWVKSLSNSPANLTIYTENWIPPEAESFLTLSWNIVTPYLIQPDEVVAVTLTLTVSGDIVGIDTFTFDIVIIASG